MNNKLPDLTEQVQLPFLAQPSWLNDGMQVILGDACGILSQVHHLDITVTQQFGANLPSSKKTQNVGTSPVQ